MDIRTQSVDRDLLLELSGELDHHAARSVIRELELAVDAALPRRLVLDLGGVTFMDSSGIALLMRAKRCMDDLDGGLLVCRVRPQVKRVMDAAGIGRLIHIRQEEAE